MWGDDGDTQRYKPAELPPPDTRERPSTERLAPARLYSEGWKDDLEDALNQLDAAPIDSAERKRLARDPGQSHVNAVLREGPVKTDRTRSQDLKALIAACSHAIAASPAHPQPWTKRGIAKARLGDLTGALTDYFSALERVPDYLPALANVASAQFHLENYEATVEACTLALERAPRLAKAWLFRGIARAKLGHLEGANNDLFHFLRLSPYSPYKKVIRQTLREYCNWDER